MMTTVILPPQPIAEHSNPLRLLPIAVNLLPEEVLAARAGSRARRFTVGFLLLVIMGNGYWYFQASQDASSAADALASSQSQLAAAKAGQNAFGGLVATQGHIGALGSTITSVTDGQVAWNRILPALRAAAPAGVVVGGITGTATPATAAVAPVTPDSTAPTPTATPTAATAGAETPIGTLVITGSAASKDEIAAYVGAIGRIPGIIAPFINSVSANQTSGGFTYSLNAGLTTASLDNRYAATTPPPTTSPTVIK